MARDTARLSSHFVSHQSLHERIVGRGQFLVVVINLSGTPQLIKKLPRYPVVPGALLGRLAVARTQQGLGLGGVLLADALKRSARAEMGVFAMVVDAENEAAQRFYEHHGFTHLPGASRRLFLPIDTALRRLASR